MSESIPPLLYHGRPMKLDPVDEPLSALKERMAKGQPIYAKLEPGDGTRYELIVTHLPHYGTLVARIDYGVERVRGVYLGDHFPARELVPMCGPNPWTRTFLDWWLHALLGMPPRAPETEEETDDE